MESCGFKIVYAMRKKLQLLTDRIGCIKTLAYAVYLFMKYEIIKWYLQVEHAIASWNHDSGAS